MSRYAPSMPRRLEERPLVLEGRHSSNESTQQLLRDAQFGRVAKVVGKSLLGVVLAGMVVSLLFSLSKSQEVVSLASRATTATSDFHTVVATEQHPVGANTKEDVDRMLRHKQKVEANSMSVAKLPTASPVHLDTLNAASVSVSTLKATPALDDSWPCKPGEQIFTNTCFKRCDTLTDGKFPVRVAHCTCCISGPCPNTLDMMETNCSKLSVDVNGKTPQAPQLTDCESTDEELFGGLCYLQCTILTYGKFPLRTGMNTCSNYDWGGNFTMGLGICTGFAIGKSHCYPEIPTGRNTAILMDGQPGAAPGGSMHLSLPVQKLEAPPLPEATPLPAFSLLSFPTQSPLPQ